MMMNSKIDPRQELFSSYSDAHKDAYGFRPTEADWARLKGLSLTQLQAEVRDMYDRVSEEIDREYQAEKKAAARLEGIVSELMTQQGISKADAYRWLMQAEGCEDDLDGFFWNFGLGCGQVAYEMKQGLS